MNEYFSSKANYFIWHPNGCASTSIDGLEVFVHAHDFNDEFSDKLELCQVKGEVIEMKSHGVDKAAIPECFYNMFAYM